MLRAMHMHDDQVEILLIRQGSGIHQIGTQKYSIAKGDIIVYNANTLHDEVTDSDVGKIFYYCAISGLKLNNLEENCIVPPGRCPVVQSGRHYDDLEYLFSLISNHATPQSEYEAEFVHNLIKALVIQITNLILIQTSDPIKEDEQLSITIKNYLDEHYLDDINLKTISNSLHINQYYMSHIFKDTYGIAPIQYVIRRRIGEAQSYLINTNMPINEIVEKVGYRNINHFHSMFVKLVGISPGKYRKFWLAK